MAGTAALPTAECLAGFEAALDNAARLQRTAESIVGNDPHSATLLAVYAADEMGKASLVARAALRRDKSEAAWQELRTEFTRHIPKLMAAEKLILLFQGGFMLPDAHAEAIARRLASDSFDHRNDVAYVGLVGNRFVPPTGAVSPAECQQTVHDVGLLLALMMDRVRPRVLEMFREDMSAGSAGATGPARP